jgi:DNA repair exonuclease SbcCD ATPase subunit
MAKDFTVMKTSLFGGFKKSDVLNLIEQLQTETSDVKESLDIKREEVLELKNKINTLEEKLDEFSGLGDKLLEKEKEIAELNEKLEAALLENKQLTERNAEYDEKSEKLRRAEKQIGAAYIDARRYSDDLVENAKSKAKDIGAFASQDIKREAAEIESLLKDVDVISRKFNSSIEQLHKDVYALSSKLNSSASNLLNLHTDLSELESHNFDYDDTNTNDDVTYTVRDEGYVSVSFDE